jgi:hypothetical protein
VFLVTAQYGFKGKGGGSVYLKVEVSSNYFANLSAGGRHGTEANSTNTHNNTDINTNARIELDKYS